MVAAKAAERNLLQKSLPISFDRHFGHVRRKPSGGDGIHLDVVNPPFAGQIFGEGDDATFAGVIADGLEFRRCTSHPGHRSDVDNLAPALRHHEFSNGLRKEKCPGQIRVHDFVPMLQLHFLDRSAPGGARVVVENVDSTELRSRLLRNVTNLVGVLDIAGQCQRFDTKLF